VVLGEVADIDLEARTVSSHVFGDRTVTAYDTLVVAAGVGQSYFGNEQFAAHAPGMKSIDDALELRGRIFGAFELAELATDDADRQRLMTFVVVGAGATGVELAGQISELARRTLRKDFRRIDPTAARVILVDAADGVLGSFGDRLGDAAAAHLAKIGVDVRLGLRVVDVDATGVEVLAADGSRHRIEAACKVWAAGVEASPLGAQLARQSGAALDRAGRVRVRSDFTVRGHPEVFVVGDLMALDDLPEVAPVAIQSARHAAATIKARLTGTEAPARFRYHDRGNMAAISRTYAVANVFGWRFSGFIAWLMWLGLHLFYIVGFKNRITTLLHWLVSFVGRGRSERTVTHQQVVARQALTALASAPLEEVRYLTAVR
jgi:NADH dehydrogenase